MFELSLRKVASSNTNHESVFHEIFPYWSNIQTIQHIFHKPTPVSISKFAHRNDIYI